MKELYDDEYSFYYVNGIAHFLPAVETIEVFDFFKYCRDYEKIGNRLVHLPVHIVEENFGPSIRHMEKLNDIISKIIGRRLFQLEKIGESSGNPVYSTELGLYLIYNAISDIFYTDNGETILEKLFTGFHITISPNCKEGALIGENIFVDKNMDRYEDFMACFGGDFFSHILLYHKLKKSGKDFISIKKNLIIQPSVETHENWNGKYTLSKHKKFSKFLLNHLDGCLNNKGLENIGDCFDVNIHENPCLFLGYILFNEFILGKHVVFCCGELLWQRNKDGYPVYNDYFLVNKDDLGNFICNNGNVYCLSLINHFYQDIYAKTINKLPIVNELRIELSSKSNKIQEIGWENEVIKEIDLIRKTTDSSKILITIKHKKIEHIKTDFQVDDISRIAEIRNFTNENGGAHIEHYAYGKRYIKGDRVKNIGGKKGRYNGNKDIDEYI